jgi:hypothetical protein
MSFAPRHAIVTGFGFRNRSGHRCGTGGAGHGRRSSLAYDEAGADATAAEVRDHGQAAVTTRTAAFDSRGPVIDKLADRLGGVDVS